MGLSLLATTDTQIIRVVEALYKQTPGYTFLTNFRTYVTENSIDDLANALASSFSSQSDAEFAATVTANLGLTGDALVAGNAYLEGQFAANPAARGKVVLDAMNELATMENDPTFGAVAASFNSNTVASLTYSTVTTNTAVLAEGVGQTFALTTATDGAAIVGTTKDDIYNGSIVHAGTTDTLTSGDVMAGGEGADILNITATGDTGATTSSVSGITTTGVETIVLTNLEADATASTLTLDTATMTGVNTFSVTNSAANGEVTFSNVAALTNANMSANAGDLTLTYLAAAVAGTADVQNISVSGTNGTFTADGVETIAITSSGSAATLADVASDAVTKLTIAGDQNLTLTAAESIKTIDASALTGGLTMTAAAAAQTITGGTGDDSFDMVGTLDKSDTLDAGDGTDTVKLSIASATVSATAITGDLINVSNVEVYDVASTGAAILDLDGITGVTTLNAAANVGVFGVPGTNETDGDIVTFVLNGTSYETAARGVDDVDLFEALVAAKINTLTGFSAVAGADVVTITNTSATSESVEFGTLAMKAGGTGTVATTGTTGYTNVTFNNMAGTETVNVYSADSVTTALKDASGTSDALTFNLATLAADKGFNQTIGDIVVANVESVTLDSSGMTAGKTKTLTALTADATLTSLTITGDSNLTITGVSGATKLATVNASALTGDLSYTSDITLAQTITTGSGNETITMGTVLSNTDVIDAGANTALTSGVAGEDTLTATVTNLTATTGALQLANVERVNLTNGGTAVIDATAITGASEIAVLTNTTQTTISNLAAGVAVGVGHKGTDGDTNGILVLSLADATGSADALSVNFNDTDGGETSTVTLKGTAIEDYTFNFNTTDTAIANTALTVSALNASTITVAGATADSGHTLTLGTLDTDTTSVNATGYKGRLTATAGSAIATTFTADSTNNHVLTGSTKDDTFNLGEIGAADIDISGSTHVSGDTLNATLTATTTDFTAVNGIETLNLTVKASTATGFDDATEDNGLNLAKTINLLGGNSLSTFAISTGSIGGGNVTAFDASNFGGKLSGVLFAEGALTGTLTVTGTANTADVVSASYTGATPAHTVKMTAVETLNIALADHATEVVLDMASVTGLTTINVTDASSELLELKNLATGVTVDVTSTDATATQVEVKLASVTGSADSQTFIVAAASADDNVKLITADIETLSISSDSDNQVDLDLSALSMTTASSVVAVNFTGANDIELAATGSQITTIDASAMTTGGALVQTARSATVASTYTGSLGDDTFIMMNKSDVLDGGAGTSDTLDIDKAFVLGGIEVDLSSTTNQISTFNGAANTAVQKGFENVDVSGVTGSFGAQITAISTGSTITGTGNADVVNGGAGVDTIVTTAGNDAVLAGAGNDIFSITDALFDNNNNTTASFNGEGGTGDSITFTDAASIVDADFARYSNVEVLTLFNGANTAVLSTIAATAGITTVTAGTSTDALTNSSGSAMTFNLGASDDSAVDTINLLAVSGTTTVTGFVSAEDTFEIVAGALLTATRSDTAEVVGDVSANTNTGETYAIETAVTGIVTDAENGTLTVANLTATTLTEVAASITGAFVFGDANADTANVEVFAVESDTAGTFGIYAWTQSTNTDTTVGADELVTLGIVTGTNLAAADLDLAQVVSKV